MKFIDKLENIEEGNSYSSDYLYDSYCEEEECFRPSIGNKKACYEEFSRKKYRYGEGLTDGRQGLEPLLIKEQNSLCCYCMGKIETKAVSLEHVIPRNFDTEQSPSIEFDFYAHYAPILCHQVELAEQFALRKFSSTEELKNIEKYPHSIAYANLTASCRGIIDSKTSCFCNTPRGNKRIIPLMLMENSDSLVTYTPSGRLSIKDLNREDVEPTLKALNLNNDTLKEIRCLWYEISRTEINIVEIKTMNKRDWMNLFKHVFKIDDYTLIDKEWKKYIDNPIYHNLFLKYEWFYCYYKTAFPSK